MEECIFCKIVEGKIPAKKVYEDDRVLVFHDVSPQAPVHVLAIPKQHMENLLEARACDNDLLVHLLKTAAEAAVSLGLSQTGFRIVSNCGPHACQSVPHLHIHILGGGQLSPTMA